MSGARTWLAGRRATRWGGAALALLLAFALVAPARSPGAETFSFGPGGVTFARVGATHGYRVDFSENDAGYFFVRVKGHGSTTDFAIKTGHPPDGRLRADFGARGKFDLRFVPVGRPEPIPHGRSCEGRPGSLQPGYLVGRARFRTERGFAQIRLHRAAAERETWSHLVCELGELPVFGHPKEKRTILTAAESDASSPFVTPKWALTFRATQFYRHARPAAHRVDFVAELKQSAGRISIHRKVLASAPERSLLFPGAPSLPEEVTVTPPAPFAGNADFLRTHESTFTWTGDLAVTFPGLSPIRLSGARFGVVICASKGCVSRRAENPASGS